MRLSLFTRIEEGETEILRVTDKGSLTQNDAQRLRGRMQFAETQLYGRTGKRRIRALREAACKRRAKLLDYEKLSLRVSVKLLRSGKPRTVCWDNRPPVVIFTDACYERDSRDLVCGLGAVMIDQATKTKQRFFSCVLDHGQREFLGELNKQQIIFEAETFCAALGYLLWMREH